MIELPEPVCVYCHGAARLYEKNAYHTYAPQHGPFDLYLCKSCGSLFTHPVPSREQVKGLYGSFDKGMFGRITELRTMYPLTAWYKQCLQHIRHEMGEMPADLSWVDIGSGDGIMSVMMNEAFPGSRGVAADFHSRPEKLFGTDVDWVVADLNDQFAVEGKFDLVFAITVFEHMLEPGHFLESMLALLKPGGVLYFNCPRSDSRAFFLMGKRWPYYLPGEHITVPSMKGLEALAKNCFSRLGGNYSIKVKPVTMPYPLGYYVGYYSGIKRKLPLNIDLYLPTGLLECVIHRQN